MNSKDEIRDNQISLSINIYRALLEFKMLLAPNRCAIASRHVTSRHVTSRHVTFKLRSGSDLCDKLISHGKSEAAGI